MFIAIAEQAPDLNTILTMMTSNRTLSTLLAPVLLRNAAESGALVSGNTVLGDALSRGNLELVDAMLSASTLRIDANNIDNWTLLATAIRDKNMDMIELLLAHGADVNAQGADRTTPLALAVLTEQHDVIRMLVAKGADVWTRIRHGVNFAREYTVLHYALLKEDIETIKVLLEVADTAKGSHAICEALTCCEYAFTEAMWWDMWDVLRPFYTPGTACEWSYDDFTRFLSLEDYFYELKRIFLLADQYV
jgi:hypothetical protein